MATGREDDEAAIVTVETLLESKTENGREFVPVDGLWRISVARYHAMIDAGVLTEDNPIELLQGWLVQKMPQKPRHSVTIAAVPIYWIVNLPDRQIEVCSQPFVGASEPDYKQGQTYGVDESVPVQIEGELVGEIPVAPLFPTSAA